MKNIVDNYKLIIIIGIICLLIRLFLFIIVGPWNPNAAEKAILKRDALEYHNFAVSLIKDHRFVCVDGGHGPYFKSDSLRTPLYPVFVGIIYIIFGIKPWIVLLFQIFLDTASCILLFITIRDMLNLRIALYAGIFYAIDPFLILWANNLFGETLLIFFCVLALYSYSKALVLDYEKKWIVFSAAAFGLACLVKPIMLYVPIVIAIHLIVFLRRNIKKALKTAGIFVFVFILILLPWFIRNYIVYNSFSLSSSGGYNLLMLYAGPIKMEREDIQTEEILYEKMSEEANNMMIKEGITPEDLNDFQKSKYWHKLAMQYINRYPLSFTKHYILGIVRSFFCLGTMHYAELLQWQNTQIEMKTYPNLYKLVVAWFNQKSIKEIIVGMLILSYLATTYICLVIGIFISWKLQNKQFLLFCAAVFLYIILLTGTAGCSRYRLPAVPFYLSFTGMGMYYIERKINRRNNFV